MDISSSANGLLHSQRIADLERQLRDREIEILELKAARDVFKVESELKIQTIRYEDEVKINKEREDNRQRLDDIKNRYDEKLRELKEALNKKETVRRRMIIITMRASGLSLGAISLRNVGRM